MSNRIGWLAGLILVGIAVHAVSDSGDIRTYECPSKGLEKKNCIFEVEGVKVWVDELRILYGSGKSLQIREHMAVGSYEKWQKVNFKVYQSRKFVEFEIWSNPSMSDDVRKLEWAIYELKSDGIIRVTQAILDTQNRQGVSSLPEDHGIRLTVDGKLVWVFGHEINPVQ